MSLPLPPWRRPWFTHRASAAARRGRLTVQGLEDQDGNPLVGDALTAPVRLVISARRRHH